jgi:hypothetical protein
MNRFDTGDIAADVVAAYSEGGNMSEFEREAAKIALVRSSGKKPEQAYAIALRFLDRMLSKAEHDFRGEMMDLARQYPIEETPEGKQITRDWECQ